MKLEKRLFVGGEEVTLATNQVSLLHTIGSSAIFTYQHETKPQRFGSVRFDIGYDESTKLWFEGTIDKVYPSTNGSHKILVKEHCAILSKRWPVSIEHPTMRDVLNYLGKQVGLSFVLPENASYIDKQIPNFTSQGTGYQCLKAIGKAFNVPDFIWFQNTDQTVYVGAFEHSRFFDKNVTLPQELTIKQAGNAITFAPFPMLRPGAIVNGKRVKRIDLINDEMTVTWEESQTEQSPKRKEMMKEFPELAAGHHLPRFGQIKAVRDESTSGQINDPFRPRHAVDVQLLTDNMQVDTKVPLYKSIPLPITMVGHEAGVLGYPLEGTIVEIAFAYGRNDLPIIRAIYGREFALPTIEPGEQLQQQREEVSKRVDPAGNTIEQTDQQQNQKAYRKHDEATHYQGELGSHTLNISEHSLENIIGKKLIEALGAIELLAGDNIELGTLGNMHTASAGDLIETIGKVRRSIAADHQWMQAPKTWIGSKEENVLILLSELMQVVKELADTLASHTHGGILAGTASTKAPNQASAITGHGGDSGELKGRVDGITKKS
ncbi:hypothetical protein [Vibrio sp. 10N.261.55.A7]|uniref:hypothetical protein n=1 Tax=Vibrio sp. 10N.261.55.A7 TaxID=1880851 RepID=UPI000C832D79|nr:hypothetical protein [Vibrio sp. 10N.261.55.A7]PMJ92871.1 hypothetical protein BCU12_06940 [Vibrio sp. 10N.261.55.A7]